MNTVVDLRQSRISVVWSRGMTGSSARIAIKTAAGPQVKSNVCA